MEYVPKHSASLSDSLLDFLKLLLCNCLFEICTLNTVHILWHTWAVFFKSNFKYHKANIFT